MPITGGGAGTVVPRGIRKRYADFLADSAVMVGTSIVRRPDAISFDYLTAHTVGPVALGDTSEGIVSWVWQARATATGVYIARANAAHDGYDAETLVFAYSGAPIEEMDFCFDQNGQPVIVAERAASLWVYYNDITLGGYGFRSFGAGRTPRVVLDDPLDVNGSDVLVFFVEPTQGIVYRQQRDRYATIYVTTPQGASPPLTTEPGMNYGPVFFRKYDYSDGFVQKGRADIGALEVIAPARNLMPMPGTPDFLVQPGPTSLVRITPNRTSGAHDPTLIYTFSQLVYGFSATITSYSVPNYTKGRAGGFGVWRNGVQVASVLVDPPKPYIPPSIGPGQAADPNGHVTFSFPAGFDELRFGIWTWDNNVIVANLNLRLSDAQLASVNDRVLVHGPAIFDYTADPAVASATVDGVVIELRAPLNTSRGVVVTGSGPIWDQLTEHTNLPGVWRPLNRDPADIAYYSNPRLPDGEQFQHGLPTAYTLRHAVDDPPAVSRLDLNLTFSAPVSGIEIVPFGEYGIATMRAYDGVGALLAEVLATQNQPNRIWAAGIRRLELWAGYSAQAWGSLRLKFPADIAAGLPGATLPAPAQVFPPAPLPPKSDVFLEDAVRTPDGRVSIFYSVRNAGDGTYSFGRIDTVLYPYHAPYDGEAMVQAITAQSGTLYQLIIDNIPNYDAEGMLQSFGYTPGGVAVLINAVAPTIAHDQPYVDEGMLSAFGGQSGVLFLVIHDFAQFYDSEGMTSAFGGVSGTIVVVVYDQVQPYDNEGMTQAFGVLAAGNSLL